MCCSSTSRRSASRRAIVDVVFDALAAIRERGLAVLLVEQRAQRTVALADRSHVLSNGELRLTLGPGDAERHRASSWRRTSHERSIDWQTIADAVSLGGIYALMAVGIGLVFGVLRLVNFAYGQLIMAGAFALALASQWNWPVWAGILLCFAVVLVLSLLMDRLVFRPLRGQSPAVMLVATFAVAFLLQSIALLWFGSLGKIASLARDAEHSRDRRRRHPQDLDRRVLVTAPAWSRCVAARADDGGAAHARRIDGLPRRRGCSASARTA